MPKVAVIFEGELVVTVTIGYRLSIIIGRGCWCLGMDCKMIAIVTSYSQSWDNLEHNWKMLQCRCMVLTLDNVVFSSHGVMRAQDNMVESHTLLDFRFRTCCYSLSNVLLDQHN